MIGLVEPDVTGTLNVLKACFKKGIKRVVLVSSLCALWMNPNGPSNRMMDEDCWSDMEYCRTSEVPLAGILLPRPWQKVHQELKLSIEKLKSLGWKYRPVQETLVDTRAYIQEACLLNKD
ncbi:hypothetical protein AAC387_Pa02g3073 [Persea americana]